MSAHVLSDRAISGLYYNRLEQGATDWIGLIAMEINSDQDSETHKWLGMPPQLREWVGGKEAKGFRDFEYAITNKDYESTIDYHERDLSEDKTGQLQVRINEHVSRVLSHPAKLITDLIIGGEAGICYDGQYFFDTDHTEGESGVQSNDLTFNAAEHTAVTAEEMVKAILASITAMMGFKDDQGEPLNENAKEFLIMVPTSLLTVALAAATTATVQTSGGGSVDNLITKSGTFKINVVVNPRLTSAVKFYTFRTDGAVKPFIDQVREKASIKVKGEGSDYYFDTRHKQVSVEKAGAVGYGLWQTSVLTTFN